MKFIRNFKRKRAIKSFIKRMPGLLAKDYGKSKAYTPMQIKRTIERNGLSVVYASYAIAMFSPKFDFDKYHEETGETCNYNEIRCDIADKHFDGNSDFSVFEITSVSSNYGGGFDDGGSSGGFDSSGGTD